MSPSGSHLDQAVPPKMDDSAGVSLIREAKRPQ